MPCEGLLHGTIVKCNRRHAGTVAVAVAVAVVVVVVAVVRATFLIVLQIPASTQEHTSIVLINRGKVGGWRAEIV
jgi:hypothetical protein